MATSQIQEVVAALNERRKELESEGLDLQKRLKVCKREVKKCNAAIAALTDTPGDKKPSVTREQMIDALRREVEAQSNLSAEEARQRAVARLKEEVGTSRGWHLVIKPALRAIRGEGLLNPNTISYSNPQPQELEP